MSAPSRRNWGWSAISIIPAIKPGSKGKLQQELDKYDLKVKVRAVLGPTTALTTKLTTLARDRQAKITVALGATGPLAAKLDALARTRTVNFRPELATGPTGTATARLNDMARARTVTLRPELSSNAAAVETRLDDVSRNRTARIDLDFAVTPQQVAAMRAITRLQDRNVTARVRIDVDQDQADRLTRLSPALRAINRLSSKDIRIKIDLDVDEARLIRVAEAMRQIRSRTVTMTVNQRERVTGGGAASRLTAGLGSLGASAAGAGAVAAKMALITGAAGLAAGAVGTLVAGVAALGVVGAAAGATAAVGLSGVADAFKALSAADDDVTGGASSLRAVEQAEKQVTRAKRDAQIAERDLTRARKEAAEQIEDLNLALKGAAVSEEDARIALEEAIRDRDKTLSDPESDAIARRKAVNEVAKAEQGLQEALERNADLAEETAQANKKGVEGSDQVTAAKQRLTDANDAVAEAQKAVTDAQNQGSASASKAEQALAKLAPSAREFVLGMRALGPELSSQLKMPTQETLFAGLTAPVTNFIRTSIPALKAGMGEVATSMNQAAKDTAAFFSTASAQQSIRDSFSGTASFITAIGPGMQQATQGFLSFASAAKPALESVGTGFGTLMGSIGQSFTDAANSGALTQLTNNFGGVLAGLGTGLKPILDGLIQAGNIIAPVLGPLFEQLGKSLGPVLPQLAQVGAELAKGLMPVLPVAANLIGSLAKAVQPLIPHLSKIAVVVGDSLVKAVDALAPSMGPIGEMFASLVSAAAPLLPVIATVASGLLQALAPALTTIFNAAGPIIKQWTELMMPVFKQLQPILAQVAGQLGTAIADAMRQIAPLLPEIAKSFGGLMMSLLPLLPPLVEMGVKLLPPILRIFMEIVPQVLKVIDVFSWLVSNVLIPMVVPAIQGTTTALSVLFDGMASGIRMARNLFGEGLSAIGGFFGDMSRTASSAWDFVVRGIAKAVKSIGELMQKAEWFPAAPAIRRLGDAYVGWAAEHMATGGLARGPGTGTSDSIPAMLSNGEFVEPAFAVTPQTLPLLEAIRGGWTPSPEFLRAMVGPVRGYAAGGLVTADELNTFAQGVEGANYEWGGVHWGDCSGAVSALVNKATGADPWGTRGTTGNFSTWLASKGLQPGMGPKGSLNVGWFVGGPYGGHAAATLPNGTNFEMGGARGNGQYGGSAVGAADPQFTDHMHLPPDFFNGGDQTPGQTTPPAFAGASPQVTTPGATAAASKTRLKTGAELGKDAEKIAAAGVVESLGLGGFEQLAKRQGDNGASARTSAAPPQQPQQPQQNPQGGNTFIAYGHTAEDVANEWSRLLWRQTGGYGGRSWG